MQHYMGTVKPGYIIHGVYYVHNKDAYTTKPLGILQEKLRAASNKFSQGKLFLHAAYKSNTDVIITLPCSTSQKGHKADYVTFPCCIPHTDHAAGH